MLVLPRVPRLPDFTLALINFDLAAQQRFSREHFITNDLDFDTSTQRQEFDSNFSAKHLFRRLVQFHLESELNNQATKL